MRFVRISVGLLSVLGMSACSSSGEIKKIVIDESDQKPSWVGDSRTAWEEGGKIYFRSSQQVRGNERLSGCYDLARMNAKTQLISEIQESIKGVLDTNEASISENAEIVLSKSRSSQFSAQVGGIRFSGEYFARYRIDDEERIDCHVLSEISKQDHTKLKRMVLSKVVEADPKIKEQIQKKHMEFFN